MRAGKAAEGQEGGRQMRASEGLVAGWNWSSR